MLVCLCMCVCVRMCVRARVCARTGGGEHEQERALLRVAGEGGERRAAHGHVALQGSARRRLRLRLLQRTSRRLSDTLALYTTLLPPFIHLSVL